MVAGVGIMLPMEKRVLGRTGMEVSALGFGGAEIGFERAQTFDVARLLGAALDAGLNVIDTAECYWAGDEASASEKLIGDAMGHRRGEYLLFTKTGHAAGIDAPDWSPELIELGIERSLKPRLAKYGVQVEDVSLIQIGFSPEFTKSIEQKQIAEQDAKKAEYDALRASKEAEAEVNRAKGTAESQKLLRQSLNRELLEKQAIEKWDGKFPTVMSGGSGALPFINITPPKN